MISRRNRHRCHRARWAGAAVIGVCALLVAGTNLPGSAQTLQGPPAGKPALAPACSKITVQSPPQSQGYPIPTVDYIGTSATSGSLSDGASSATGIYSSMCSVFQVPEYPQLHLPPVLFPDAPAVDAAKPQSAAQFAYNEITYAPATITLNTNAAPGLGSVIGTLVTKLGLGLPALGSLVLEAAPTPAGAGCQGAAPTTSICALIEQQNAPGGGFQLDIVAETINIIDIPSAANPMISCTLAPAAIPFSTNGHLLAPSERGTAAAITGPLDDASATVVSTPQFVLPNVQSCTGLAPAVSAQLLDTLLHPPGVTPVFVSPLSLNLSLTSGPNG